MAERANTFLLVTVLVLVVTLAIFGMKYFVSVRTSRLRTASEDASRHLAERAIRAQEESGVALSKLNDTVSDLNSRLSRVENVLKEVE